MNNQQINKDYERDAQAFANVARCIPPRIVDNAYNFSIAKSNVETHNMELDYCPKQWRGDRNFVDICANPALREWLFNAVAAMAQHPDKTRTLLKSCNLDATAEDEEFRKEIFYVLCMALVSVVFIKKHLAFTSASGLN